MTRRRKCPICTCGWRCRQRTADLLGSLLWVCLGHNLFQNLRRSWIRAYLASAASLIPPSPVQLVGSCALEEERKALLFIRLNACLDLSLFLFETEQQLSLCKSYQQNLADHSCALDRPCLATCIPYRSPESWVSRSIGDDFQSTCSALRGCRALPDTDCMKTYKDVGVSKMIEQRLHQFVRGTV